MKKQKKQNAPKTAIGSVIAKHIAVIDSATRGARSNPFLAMAAEAANEAANGKKP